MPTDASLRFQDVVKTFGGTRAVKGVSFAVGAGEIVALLGENGAGKSTLIKILGGIHRADSGKVLLGGEPYAPSTSRARRRGGSPSSTRTSASSNG